jgi:hypothetical protein
VCPMGREWWIALDAEFVKLEAKVEHIMDGVMHRVNEIAALPFSPGSELCGIRMCVGTSGYVKRKTSDVLLEVPLKNLLIGQWSIHDPRLTLQVVVIVFYAPRLLWLQPVGVQESDRPHYIAPVHLLPPKSCAQCCMVGPR